MDNNQEPQSVNPNGQEPSAQPSSGAPSSVVPPSQSSVTPPQDPNLQPQLDTQPSMPSVSPASPGERKGPLTVILIALVVLFVLAAGAYLLITHNNKAAKFTYNHTAKGSQPSSGTTTSTTSDIAGEKAVPFGKTATDGTFQVKLLSTTLTPTVTGDQPDAGTQYLEADFSVTTLPNKNNYAFTMRYLSSTVPSGDKMGNIELAPVDSLAGGLNPLTFKRMAAKNVQVTGKASTESYSSIPNDGSAKTVTVYSLFEIKSGDKGQIVWQGLDGGTYHFLTQ